MIRPLARRLLPEGLRRAAAHWLRRRQRRRALERSRAAGPATRASLLADLRAAGIAEGDVLLVHSSLSGLGFVEGGAAAVVDALLAAVGPSGTVFAPIFPLRTSAHEHLLTDPVYDPATTPSAMGAASEELRRRRGAVVGAHPTHPVAGVGPEAAELLATHAESEAPCGPTSVFARFVARGGKILALGSPFAHVTSFHVVETSLPAFPVRAYLPEPVRARVRMPDGGVVERRVRVHDPEVARRRLEVRPDWARRIEEECRARGAVADFPAGRGRMFVFDARRLERALEDMASEGITIFEPEESR